MNETLASVNVSIVAIRIRYRLRDMSVASGTSPLDCITAKGGHFLLLQAVIVRLIKKINACVGDLECVNDVFTISGNSHNLQKLLEGVLQLFSYYENVCRT